MVSVGQLLRNYAMVFACRLLLLERVLEECIPLTADEAFAERRFSLQALLV